MSKTFHPLVAQKLRDARRLAGKSQDDVAGHLHIGQQAYSRYETDTGIPMRYLSKVCEFLDLSANELVALYNIDATPVGVEGE